MGCAGHGESPAYCTKKILKRLFDRTFTNTITLEVSSATLTENKSGGEGVCLQLLGPFDVGVHMHNVVSEAIGAADESDEGVRSGVYGQDRSRRVPVSVIRCICV
jgi:hypothetical protein